MISTNEILIRLCLASFLGAMIGLERERKDWVAGMRTHMMVCLGACLIMIVSSFGFSDILGTDHVTLDPSRIAAQVISGIGFIGAGTILFIKQGTVRGLTTASGLWTVAAIGLATGGGLYFAAGVTTVLALIILWALQPLELIFSKKFKHRTLKISVNQQIDNTELIKKLLSIENAKLQSFALEKNNDELVYLLKFDDTDIIHFDNLLTDLKNNSSIKDFIWS
ncbi:MAG: MgtC/SapB family protein [Saprospiraceae bacterium]|nr:MgtC/SapB family protein [Saprospiraceae bacterium]